MQIKKVTIPFILVNIIISSVLLFNNTFLIDAHFISFSISLSLSYYACVFISFLAFHYVIYLICLKKQTIFKSIILILLVSSFIIGYYSLKYKVNIDYIFIINVINEYSQINQVVSLKDILIICLFTALMLYLFLKINITKHYLKSTIRSKNTVIITSTLLVIFIISTQIFKYVYIANFNNYRGLNRGLRQEITHNINYYKYFYIIKGVTSYYKNMPSQAQIMASIKLNDVVLDKKAKNITTLFVMADSVRAKSMSLFNYELETNPNLQKLYDNKQIYIFKQMSCYTSTFISLNCMLNLRKADDFRKLEASSYAKEKITKYFNYLGINTLYLYNNIVNYFYNGYKYVPYKKELPALDSSVLPYLYNSIDSGSQFITVNLRGAHIPYSLMLEERFKKFDNDYDNKILQIDYIWSDIIKYLNKQNKPIFAIFVSDHGQSFGEYHNGVQYFVHGAEINIAPPEQTEVPLIIYVNDAYKKLYPNYLNNIYKNMKIYKGKLISSDVISHSLLHCSGIEGNAINKSLSLCN